MKVSTKLVGVIGVVVVAASVATGLFVFRGAEQTITAQTKAQLETERESRARLVNDYFRRVHDQLGISARQLVTQIVLRDMAVSSRASAQDFAQVRERFHPYARGLVEAFGYHDVLLIGADGNVVYSYSNIDVTTGAPLRSESGAGQAFGKSHAADQGSVHFVDYTRDSKNVPAAFASTPVFDTQTQARLGVLIFNLSVDAISEIMADAAGFGASGETYLIGPDLLMRNNSRFSQEPTALTRAIQTPAARRGLAGESGTIEQADYRGVPVFASFAPLDVLGVRWSIVVKTDVAEALAPVHLFQSRSLLLLGIVGLVAAFVMWEALRRIVLRPLAALGAGAQRVAASDYTHPVALRSADELGQLGRSFDGMMAAVGGQVDELKRARATTQESEERLAAAARGANLGLWDVNPADGSVMVNAIFESQLGYRPLELRETDGKWAALRGGLSAWPELLHPDDRERVTRLIGQFLAGESELYRAEHRVRAADGTYRWILSVGNSMDRDAAGRPSRVNGIHIDISDMKNLEQLRDGLVHMIIHDLRSPLTSVMGYLDLIKSMPDAKAEDMMRFVGESYDGASQMSEMISSLLDINRLEAGEMPIDRQPADLNEVAADALRSLGGLIIGRKVTQMPSGPVMCDCDAALIRRVVTNLMGNALKFTPSSGSITVTVSKAGNGARVEVADTGPGIPPEFLGKVFDKFSQGAEGRARKRYSTGLGLAFCKLAVEAHGGKIGVTSEVGVGTRFWFELPN